MIHAASPLGLPSRTNPDSSTSCSRRCHLPNQPNCQRAKRLTDQLAIDPPAAPATRQEAKTHRRFDRFCFAPACRGSPKGKRLNLEQGDRAVNSGSRFLESLQSGPACLVSTSELCSSSFNIWNLERPTRGQNAKFRSISQVLATTEFTNPRQGSGDEGARTLNPCLAKAVLSQLSYVPGSEGVGNRESGVGQAGRLPTPDPRLPDKCAAQDSNL